MSSPYREAELVPRCRVCGAETSLHCSRCACSICETHAHQVPAQFFVPVYVCADEGTCVAPRHESKRYESPKEFLNPWGILSDRHIR